MGCIISQPQSREKFPDAERAVAIRDRRIADPEPGRIQPPALGIYPQAQHHETWGHGPEPVREVHGVKREDPQAGKPGVAGRSLP